MKKLLLVIFITLVVLAIAPFAIIGLVPGLSSVIGAGPKDLGIKITKEDSAASRNKVGTEIIAIKPGDSRADFTLEGAKDADFTMDSKELTALSNNRPWKNYPVKNLQIKIHDDGTIESSGILIISKAIPYAMGLGYSEGQIRDAMKKYKIPPLEVPVYVVGKGSVVNDAVAVDAQTVKIGAVTVPDGIVSQANGEAESVLNDIIRKHSSSFHAESVSFTGGSMHFKGKVPLKEYVYTD